MKPKKKKKTKRKLYNLKDAFSTYLRGPKNDTTKALQTKHS